MPTGRRLQWSSKEQSQTTRQGCELTNRVPRRSCRKPLSSSRGEEASQGRELHQDVQSPSPRNPTCCARSGPEPRLRRPSVTEEKEYSRDTQPPRKIQR